MRITFQAQSVITTESPGATTPICVVSLFNRLTFMGAPDKFLKLQLSETLQPESKIVAKIVEANNLASDVFMLFDYRHNNQNKLP